MRTNRNGFTLVELLTTVTVGSTLMVLALNLVHQTMLLSQAARDRCQRMQSTNLFIDQFRQDIHAAKSVVVTPDQELTVEFENVAAVIYRAIDNRITREQQPINDRAHRETLNLGDHAHCHFKLLKSPSRVALTIASETDIADSQRVDRHVEAVVGRFGVAPPTNPLP